MIDKIIKIMSRMGLLRSASNVDRIYFVAGEPVRPAKYRWYDTSPDAYGLSEVGSEVIEVESKVFLYRSHAVDFACRCNLVSVVVRVFDRRLSEGGWELNLAETESMIESIS